MFGFESSNRREFEALLAKVRTTLGLANDSQQHQTDVSSVVHSRTQTEMEGTFGKTESNSCEPISEEFSTAFFAKKGTNQECIGIVKSIASEVPSSRESCSRNRVRLPTESKENSRMHDNFRTEGGHQSEAVEFNSHPMRLMDSCRPHTIELKQGLEERLLKNQIERYKDRELQLRMECERLNKQLTKMHSEKEVLYREFERKCRQFVELTNQSTNSKENASKHQSKFKQDQEIISLNNQLRQARFIIEQLKLEAGRIDYLERRQPVPVKITQFEQKIVELLSDKFYLEEKVQIQERMLRQSGLKSAFLVSDLRIKTLRESLDFWIKKSKRIEEEAYRAISTLRLDCEHLKNDLLHRNSEAQMQLRTQMKRLQNLKQTADTSLINASCILPLPQNPAKPTANLKSATTKKVRARSSSNNAPKFPSRVSCR